MKYDEDSVRIATKILWGLACVFALGFLASLYLNFQGTASPSTFGALVLGTVALAAIAPGQVRAYIVWGGWWPFS